MNPDGKAEKIFTDMKMNQLYFISHKWPMEAVYELTKCMCIHL